KTVGEMTKKGVVSTLGFGEPPVYSICDQLGLDALKLPKDLQNGNFEAGLKGWSAVGDGRFISILGTVHPTNKDFMAIISTGLGFTTSSGSIFQSFTVPSDAQTLKFDWNLLSEEFLEFIGSLYQDKFEVVIKDESGSENVFISKTIDQIAADYGATIDMSGSLINVSPKIKFDVGGVFMTGYINASFDISAYQGKCITLEFRCSDVGDSSFDTAVVIDNVQIEK
ncbi:MAG TPA: choice-of-anchor L domain-containing protein, partial [Saprospiraceae bacterium]|nr:choice-of-anchor L domain-containing protein [Saprospiraceae bacterium]